MREQNQATQTLLSRMKLGHGGWGQPPKVTGLVTGGDWLGMGGQSLPPTQGSFFSIERSCSSDFTFKSELEAGFISHL